MKVANGKIVDGKNNPVVLKGVAFGNEIWSDKPVPSTHHDEADYARIKAMGMNVIRFYLNYRTFEDDAKPYSYKAEGWEWIDRNIAWAKANGIYLILNMHAPQGGYQSQGKGDALWDVASNQDRLVALWKAIATRYKEEPTIIGFGPVNEPVPTKDISQWEQLAQRIINEVRKVDRNHIFFVEKAIWVKGKPETADQNFPLVSDANTAYEFHFYDPFLYTHQLFSWAGTGEGGKYPDDNIISVSNAQWYTATFNNPVLTVGNADWRLFEGQRFTINDPKIKVAIPALVGAGVGGRVYFDQIVIREYDNTGVATGMNWTLPLDQTEGWSYWSVNSSGTSGLSTTTSISGGKSLYIEGSSGDCNLSNWNAVFVPKQGFAYAISGYMKGENVAASAACRLRLDFYTSDEPVYARNKAYLEAALRRTINWAARKNVPVYLGEFGTGAPCFKDGKGGLAWVNDMLDLLLANQVAFTYHAYHEDSFGIYYGYGTLPDPGNANTQLINLFTRKLN